MKYFLLYKEFLFLCRCKFNMNKYLDMCVCIIEEYILSNNMHL